MNKTQIAGLASAAVLVGAVGFGAVSLVNGANASAEPTPTPTAEPFDYSSIPYTNGLAEEQEAEAAAALEQARLAAEAEAARIAAEQAAAAEAERIAAEQQAAAEAESYEEPEPVYDEPEPEPFTGPDPGTQVHTICEVLADGTQIPCQN